jgi:hypothetical protein
MNATTLRVDASRIPAELKAIERWVNWVYTDEKGKVPKRPSGQGNANVNYPQTWSDFDSAIAAYRTGQFAGIGFVLNGDGIVGLDLDDCISNGVPTDAAMEILRITGCQYVELSPSGTGLRGFGYRSGATSIRGTANGTKVEMYSDVRYLTVTGNALQAGPLVELVGWDEIRTSIVSSRSLTPLSTEETEVTEEMDSISSVSSVSSVCGQATSLEFPDETIPNGPGHRQHCIFHLAKHLRSQDARVDVNEHQKTVKEWHRRVLVNIGTKSWSVTWADFCRAYERIKYSAGKEFVNDVLPRIQAPPAHLMFPDDDEVMGKLVSLCVALHEHERGGVFFLSCRVAAGFIGTDFRSAAALLKLLVTRGILIVVERGTKVRATRYRLSGNRT